MTDLQTSTVPDVGAVSASTKTQAAVVTNDMPFEEVEPYHEPVDLGTLLDEIADSVQRHIVCEKETAYATALWIAMTYLVPLFDIVAFLVITAPEMRCGKSELKRLIGKMVLRPLEADNMSVAVLFRCFDLWHPTLLVDEYDTFIKKDEELRGVFNAGHQRGGCVWRCVGEKFVPTAFEVFGPKVLAGIGRLPSTLMDRGIILQLRRKLPSETIMRQRDVPATYFREIQAKLGRMAIDYATSISAARPALPDTLSDRARDNWEPLLQIAFVAGGDWPTRAYFAALKLSGKRDDTQTVGVELLSDLQEVFARKKVDRLSSADIVKALCFDEEKRWATYNKGFPITPTQVARRLRDYGISSNTIRVNSYTLKGYFLKQFADAFDRYVFADSLSEAPTVTPSPANKGENSPVTPALHVTPPSVTRNEDGTCQAPADEGCDSVAPEAGGTGPVVDAPTVTRGNAGGTAHVTDEVPSQGDCYDASADTPEGVLAKVHEPRPEKMTVARLAAKRAVEQALSGIVQTD